MEIRRSEHNHAQGDEGAEHELEPVDFLMVIDRGNKHGRNKLARPKHDFSGIVDVSQSDIASGRTDQ